jgi:CRP-like cAMP-binding protein
LATVVVESALVRKLSRFAPLERGELAALADLEARRRPIAAGIDLVHEQQAGHHAFILIEGWACAYKMVPDGGRQVIDFPIPGDFMGLRSMLMRTSDHAFAALTDVVVAEITARQMLDGFQRQPRLAAAILWAASRDEAMVVEHLVGIGRRSALVRTAHLLIELGQRLQLVGLGSEAGYACPLSQYALADALGLSAIHVNRVLRQLRERHLVTFRNGQVELHDLAGLKALAEWHGGYLDQSQPLLPS